MKELASRGFAAGAGESLGLLTAVAHDLSLSYGQAMDLLDRMDHSVHSVARARLFAAAPTHHHEKEEEDRFY